MYPTVRLIGEMRPARGAFLSQAAGCSGVTRLRLPTEVETAAAIAALPPKADEDADD